TEIGNAGAILRGLKKEHQIFICELAAYKKGEIKSACKFVKPQIGILTGINQQHLSLFGSQQNIIDAKFELIEALPEDGAAFFNERNKFCLELYQKTKIRKFLYGKQAGSAGEENILGAIAVARELGMTEEEIQEAVRKIGNSFPGIKVRNGINGLKIVDATYSSNPDGIMAHLDYLKQWKGKKVLVMFGLIELGSASSEIYRKIGERVKEICDLAIITTEDGFNDLKAGGGEKVILMKDPLIIFEKIKNFCQAGDVVLLESRVPVKLKELLLQ
ncbi:MAG: Mur ligase family protein, partial [Candidatus Pacebacteria bacterium]|nr:Mur ligase family protein [Candidatus Paceibacterota bacterium]